jgi:nucleoside-diphosphate-sugar epimerase
MRVLLTGATGYIGEFVLDALVRAGHEVTAVVRNAARLKVGSAERVMPLTGDLASPASWASAIDRHDVLVHAAMDGGVRGPEVDRLTVDAIVAGAARAARDGRSLAVIYTSGIWVLGPRTQPATEDALVAPADLVAWRPLHESLVLGAHGGTVRTIVVRPGIVFGGARGLVADMMRGAANGLIRVVGNGQNRWPLIYGRDLADLYVRLAASPTASGIFHATDDSDERVIDIVEALASHVTVRPDVRHVPIDEARAKMGQLADALCLDQLVRSPQSRALGWEPAFRSITANMSQVFEEWRVGQATGD